MGGGGGGGVGAGVVGWRDGVREALGWRNKARRNMFPLLLKANFCKRTLASYIGSICVCLSIWIHKISSFSAKYNQNTLHSA